MDGMQGEMDDMDGMGEYGDEGVDMVRYDFQNINLSLTDCYFARSLKMMMAMTTRLTSTRTLSMRTSHLLIR